jgi:glycosyltransferase involved in cell wall biosynthesis
LYDRLRPAVRICIVYDCLFPWTVGGAERWYRNLADELARADHEVAYLTRRQWAEAEEPQIDGVRVFAVSGEAELYGADGNRRVGPPLRFGLGVLRHLVRHRRDYDAVHLCAFPYFSLLAARLALIGTRAQIGVDWFEVWTRDYWLGYLGPVGGRIGHAVQRLCVRATPQAFVFSRLHARRLAEEGLRGEPVVLAGLYAGEPLDPALEPERLVVFAGRHIAEKRAPAVPAAIAAARARIPELRGLILGDGPQRPQVLAAIAQLGLNGSVEAPGFVASDVVRDALTRALCLLLPSAREGYGLVVIEAAAAGTPSIVVAGADNAAVELVDDGANGFVVASAEPSALADAIVRVHERGAELRASTRAWFEREGSRLTAAASTAAVLELYASARS